MGKEIHTINESDDISAAYREMRTNHIGRLPVVDNEDKLKGMLSIHNLVSRSFDGQEDHVAAPGENISKTIKALADRYSKKEAKADEAAVSISL
ncbi:MAG: CBS domain-containing protein [Bacteroidia bacterium]